MDLRWRGGTVVISRLIVHPSHVRPHTSWHRCASSEGTRRRATPVAFIYVSGYGVQLERENYFVPVDAKIARDSDVAAEAIRMSDYIRPLAALTPQFAQ
jgi:hypothetical protein